MPEARANFPSHEGMSPLELQDRLQFLKAKGSVRDAPIEVVEEIVALMGLIRRRSAGPPKTTRAARTGGSKSAASLADL